MDKLDMAIVVMMIIVLLTFAYGYSNQCKAEFDFNDSKIISNNWIVETNN